VPVTVAAQRCPWDSPLRREHTPALCGPERMLSAETPRAGYSCSIAVVAAGCLAAVVAAAAAAAAVAVAVGREGVAVQEEEGREGCLGRCLGPAAGAAASVIAARAASDKRPCRWRWN